MNAGVRRSTTCAIVVASLAVGLAACGVRAQSEPEPVPRDRLPSVEPGSQSPTSRERVWGSRDQRLVPVFVDLVGTGVDARINALLRLGAAEQQPPTSIPAETRLMRVEEQGEAVILTFTDELLRVSRREVPFVLGQLVLTATEEPGVAAVSVRSAGRQVRLVTSDGTTLSRPLRRSDFVAFLD